MFTFLGIDMSVGPLIFFLVSLGVFMQGVWMTARPDKWAGAVMRMRIDNPSAGDRFFTRCVGGFLCAVGFLLSFVFMPNMLIFLVGIGLFVLGVLGITSKRRLVVKVGSVLLCIAGLALMLIAVVSVAERFFG